MKGKETVIILSENFAEHVFSIASIIRALPYGERAHLVTAKTGFLSDKNRAQENIPALRSGADTDLYIIDYGPSTFREAEQLLSFYGEFKERVVIWTGRGWRRDQIEEINRSRTILSPTDAKTDTIMALEEAEVQIPPHFKTADRALRSYELKRIMSNPLSRRYYTALDASRAFDYFNNMDSSLTLVASYCEELNGKTINPFVELLTHSWQKIEGYTELALSSLRDDLPVFTAAKNMGRSVGYVDLGEVSAPVNIRQIMRQACPLYPYLVVVRYRLSGRSLMCFESLKFNVKEQLGRYKLDDLNPEITLDLLNVLVTTHQEPLFSSLNERRN